jgi:hypothetical protein
VNRLALLPIATSDDGKLCSEDCPALGTLEEGEPYCGAWALTLRDEEDEDGDDRKIRLPECIEATSQADRLVAVRDAAVTLADKATGNHDQPSTDDLCDADLDELCREVERLESTRASQEGSDHE